MMAWVKEHSTVTVRYAIRLPTGGFPVDFGRRKKAVGRDGLDVIEPRTIFQPLDPGRGHETLWRIPGA